jgi:magnesium and cobalt exporter, CNNM family
MHAIFAETLVILGLIVLSGLLGMSRSAIEVAKKSRLSDWSTQGDHAASAALVLRNDPRKLEWTVQLFGTLVTVAIGVYAGAYLVPELGRAIGGPRGLSAREQIAIFWIVILTVTLASMLFSEIMPRRLALLRPERTAGLLALPVRGLSLLAVPVMRLLNWLTDLLLRAIGIRPAQEPPVTQEEVSLLLQQGTKAGVFEEGEHEMIKRVFRFCDRRARALMTPRSDVVWLDVADPPEEIRNKIISSHHTRFPVCDQSLDNLLGIVQIKDLLGEQNSLEPYRIKGRLTVPLFIYEGTRGLKTLETFKKSASRVAVVLDEFGTVLGLVTLSDILQAIVGDMPTKPESQEQPAAVQRPDGSWLLDGLMALDEFRDLFELVSLPEGDFHTLAGFVVTQLGHIPRIAESFEWQGLSFEIVDMDGNRVDRILVKRIEAS